MDHMKVFAIVISIHSSIRVDEVIGVVVNSLKLGLKSLTAPPQVQYIIM